MTDENPIPDKKKIKKELVAITEKSSQKIDGWIDQVNAKKKINLSRKDILNWLIEGRADTLANGEINSLINTFYDEEAFLRQILRDVKQAKKDGQTNLALEVLVRPKKAFSKEPSPEGHAEEMPKNK